MNKHYQVAKRVTLVNASTNSLLAILKIVIGGLGHSQALVADGIHSISDIITDALILLAAKFGSEAPDPEHPYGHRRIETLGALLVSLIIVGAGLGIAWDAIRTLWLHQASQVPSHWVSVVAIISVIANEGLYRYTLMQGKSVNSQLLITNAWHNRSDAFVSLIVVVSVIAAQFGLHNLDEVGAIIIAVFVLKMGFGMAFNGLKELIDTGVDAETLNTIERIIKDTPGVHALHMLRTRSLGGSIFADVHIIVSPTISVSEGHYISEKVHYRLHDGIKEISDVTVHIDPEDDEIKHPNTGLPCREVFLPAFKKTWGQLSDIPIDSITLHYLDGKMSVDVFFQSDKCTIAHSFNADLLTTLQRDYPCLEKISLWQNRD